MHDFAFYRHHRSQVLPTFVLPDGKYIAVIQCDIGSRVARERPVDFDRKMFPETFLIPLPSICITAAIAVTITAVYSQAGLSPVRFQISCQVGVLSIRTAL